MKQFNGSIPIGIGDLLYIRAMFDHAISNYSRINISLYTELIRVYNKNPENYQFVNDLAKLLFSEPPYHLTSELLPFQTIEQLSLSQCLEPQKPELSHVLCKGESLNIDEPYIVINTKVRYVSQIDLDSIIKEFWIILNELSCKYKIVILGERIIEMNQEYQHHNSKKIYIFSLYDHIINNITNHDRIIDLSIDALGITSPDLKKLQQDCLIMNEAKFVIQFGVGGSFCLATSVANTIGYRTDDEYIGDKVFNKTYPNAMITKEWELFISALKGYL